MVEKIILAVGKRKRAIARARIKKGKGIVKINSKPLSLMTNELVRLKIEEPLILIGDAWKAYDIQVNVQGGGILGQADAARQAISKGLVKLLGDETKKTLLEYDRNLLVYDTRRTEPHKPSRSSQGPRRHKQRSKR
ncbi:MAG: 30S ribosomal protein S9 [Candidatus Aenigmatarchaeota archaeon]|nr:30S ribosomal protein S9 [Nanoarchaeota archaeon]